VQQIVELYGDEVEHYRNDVDAASVLATDPIGPLPSGVKVDELAAWTVVSNVLLNLDGVLTRN
jgi:hypothetical protein